MLGRTAKKEAAARGRRAGRGASLGPLTTSAVAVSRNSPDGSNAMARTGLPLSGLVAAMSSNRSMSYRRTCGVLIITRVTMTMMITIMNDNNVAGQRETTNNTEDGTRGSRKLREEVLKKYIGRHRDKHTHHPHPSKPECNADTIANTHAKVANGRFSLPLNLSLLK
jgi:hypothetical protein